jgi:hypothetical protein
MRLLPVAAGDGELENPTCKSAVGALTVARTVAELLDWFRSPSSVVTEAVFVIVPGTVGVTTIVTVTLVPTPRLPNRQYTTPLLSTPIVPCVVFWDMSATPGGNALVNVTELDVLGPLFVMLKV